MLSSDSIREEIISLLLCCQGTFRSDNRESHEEGKSQVLGCKGTRRRGLGRMSYTTQRDGAGPDKALALAWEGRVVIQ